MIILLNLSRMYSIIFYLVVVLILSTNSRLCLAETGYTLTELDDSIDALREKLRHHGSGDDEIAVDSSAMENWANLGMLLQIKDVRWQKEGVELKYQALNAFNRALQINNASKRPNSNFSILVNYRRGLLLKMMGKGDEAINSHDQALSLSVSKFDQATLRHHKAEALGMLGRLSEAISNYKDALSLWPGYVAAYLPYVKSLKEENSSSRDEWLQIISDIIAAIKRVKEGVNSDPNEFANSVLMKYEITGSGTEIGSDAYWALFEVRKSL